MLSLCVIAFCMPLMRVVRFCVCVVACLFMCLCYGLYWLCVSISLVCVCVMFCKFVVFVAFGVYPLFVVCCAAVWCFIGLSCVYGWLLFLFRCWFVCSGVNAFPVCECMLYAPYLRCSFLFV